MGWSDGCLRQHLRPREALAAIREGNDRDGYAELWEQLHHQGDLGTAAYAVVPELLGIIAAKNKPDWRPYALIATVEECRLMQANPKMPDWLAAHYATALAAAVVPALQHLSVAQEDLDGRAILAVLAYAKGQPAIAVFAMWTVDEQAEAVGLPGAVGAAHGWVSLR